MYNNPLASLQVTDRWSSVTFIIEIDVVLSISIYQIHPLGVLYWFLFHLQAISINLILFFGGGGVWEICKLCLVGRVTYKQEGSAVMWSYLACSSNKSWKWIGNSSQMWRTDATKQISWTHVLLQPASCYITTTATRIPESSSLQFRIAFAHLFRGIMRGKICFIVGFS